MMAMLVDMGSEGSGVSWSGPVATVPIGETAMRPAHSCHELGHGVCHVRGPAMASPCTKLTASHGMPVPWTAVDAAAAINLEAGDAGEASSAESSGPIKLLVSIGYDALLEMTGAAQSSTREAAPSTVAGVDGSLSPLVRIDLCSGG